MKILYRITDNAHTESQWRRPGQLIHVATQLSYAAVGRGQTVNTVVAAVSSLGEGKRGWLAAARKVPTMQHKRTRTMGRVGVGLAFISSMLMLAGTASAAAEPREHRDGRFSVYLTGDELRDGGDRDGTGFAHLDFDLENERVCYVLTWRRLDGDVNAFHLHDAPRYQDGGHWIDFFNDQRFDGEEGTVGSCVRTDRWKIRAVLDDPSDYYLNVHTTRHETGAIRGQLS